MGMDTKPNTNKQAEPGDVVHGLRIVECPTCGHRWGTRKPATPPCPVARHHKYLTTKEEM